MSQCRTGVLLRSQTLTNSEQPLRALVYAENHNQSIVGGQSLAEALLCTSKESVRKFSKLEGIALLKMIRLITLSLAGSAYVNFMGNEFGHPEALMEVEETENVLGQELPRICHVNDTTKVTVYTRGNLLWLLILLAEEGRPEEQVSLLFQVLVLVPVLPVVPNHPFEGKCAFNGV